MAPASSSNLSGMGERALELFLADPETYKNISKWEDASLNAATVDTYWNEANFDRKAWGGKAGFRREYKRLNINDKLEIHDVLNIGEPNDRRISQTDFDLVQKYFNKAGVDRETFGRAVLGLRRSAINMLLQAAHRREASVNRSGFQAPMIRNHHRPAMRSGHSPSRNKKFFATGSILATDALPTPGSVEAKETLAHPKVAHEATADEPEDTQGGRHLALDDAAESTPKKASAIIKKTPKKSPFFPSIAQVKEKRSVTGTVSSISFPPLSQKSFGLVQETLADDPFQLLVVVIFLNKTRGSVALPVFWRLMELYPTPHDLIKATHEEVVGIIQHLGLQNQRAKKIISLAHSWVEHAPKKGHRYRTLHYPNHGDGKDIKTGEILADDDERIGSWEIAHLMGIGDYALDSWRIFCRDKLRGLAEGYKGEAAGLDFEPEWMRVVPKDKELRAYLRWMWLRKGWEWDPLTGRKKPASNELLQQAEAGNIVWEEREWEEELQTSPTPTNTSVIQRQQLDSERMNETREIPEPMDYTIEAMDIKSPELTTERDSLASNAMPAKKVDVDMPEDATYSPTSVALRQRKKRREKKTRSRKGKKKRESSIARTG